MSIGAAFQLAKRLRKKTQPLLVECVNDPNQMLTSERVAHALGPRKPNPSGKLLDNDPANYLYAAADESAVQFHQRLIKLAKAQGAPAVFIGPSAETLRREAKLRKHDPVDL